MPDPMTLPEDVTGLRRVFHARPETAFTELWTSATVATELRRLGYRVRTGADAMDLALVPAPPTPAVLAEAAERARGWGAPGDALDAVRDGRTAVIADLDGGTPGPSVAVRVDMDALPLAESTAADHAPAAAGFGSAHDGFMHACGHDGHVAIGLALARRLAAGDFPGRVRLLFQPAEEGGRGARAMLGANAVDGIDRLYAIHVGLGLPSGTIAAGTHGFFATAKLRITFTGRQAHASAAPEEGRNALLAAASATLGLHALPRFAAADTRVNVGVLRAGTAPNIVAAHAEMLAELRSPDGDVCDDLERRARAVLDGAATAHGVTVEVERIGASTTADCDPGPVRAIADAARGVPGVVTVADTHPIGASDDATLLMRAVQAAGGEATYIGIGASSPGPHHSPEFDIDETCLPLAVATLERAIRGTR